MADHTNILREAIKRRRDLLSPDDCTAWSAKISTRLLSLPAYEHSQHIAIYISHRQEVDTGEIIERIWTEGKQAYIPVLAEDGQHLYFTPYTQDTVLQKNRYGIYEPQYQPEQCISNDHLDLVITPLVAFDSHCHRIGMGAGFYDRTFYFLNQQPRPVKPILVGLAYDFQKEEQLEHQPWDVNLNFIITESHVYSLHGHVE